jgi:hypothetical protein
MCGQAGYVFMDHHWMCQEHYFLAEALEPD